MSYLLPSYLLTIEQDDLEELRCDVWDDRPVPAYLQANKTIYDIDLAYRGSYTRELKKKSYWVKFVHPSRFNGAREIHLNAEYKDPSLIRNKLSLDFFNEIGVLSPQSQHVTLTRNQSFKGVYLQLESVDDLFLKKRGLSLGPIYYAINNNANFSLTRDRKQKKSLLSGYKQAIGNRSDDEFFSYFIQVINTVSKADFSREIKQFLHVDKYLRWLAGAVCVMNNDGFTHNYALYRSLETGLFEMIPWDYDATWGRNVSGGIMRHDYVPLKGKKGNYLSHLLLQITEFRQLYRSILEEILETTFSIKKMEKKVLFLYQGLRQHVLLDPYKKKSINTFDAEPDFIFEFIRKRRKYLKKQLAKRS